MIEIEKNIPIPNNQKHDDKPTKFATIIHSIIDMKVGDSFILPLDWTRCEWTYSEPNKRTYVASSYVYKAFKALGWSCQARKIDENWESRNPLIEDRNKVRCWRVK
tara:strand:+ start:1203 stop:1520 length:318 start_codon:yes stop_codon:yes gene_type:complete